MSSSTYIPRPVFDTLTEVIDQHKTIYEEDNPRQAIRQRLNFCFTDAKVTVPSYASKDYQLVLNFLYSYRGSADTFNAYRRDLERLLQWSWFVHGLCCMVHIQDMLV